MAWEELLKQKEGEPRPSEPEGAASRGRDGLIAQICGETVPAESGAPAKSSADEAHMRLPDGYVRRTPVQEYRVSQEYKRKRIRRAVLAVVVLGLLVLLVLAVLKSGLIKLR